MNIINAVLIKLFSKYIGSDQFGNTYYESYFTGANQKKKRRVVYKGIAEPTKIPPMWHMWLHYSTNQIPSSSQKYKWQKGHLPNLTGTNYSYSPEKYADEKTSKKYTAWRPN